MRTLMAIVVLALAGWASAADNPILNPNNNPGMNGIYFESGPNYSLFRRENFSEFGTFYNLRDQLGWFSLDDDDEPIDEIIVIAKRTQQGAYFELAGRFRFGNMFKEVCTGYTDGGHCNSTMNIVDTTNWPLLGACQSVTGSMGPLTGAEANALNLEYQQNSAAVSGGMTLGAALGSAAATAGASAVVQLLATGVVSLGTLAATYPDVGDFPFTAGDVVTYTMSACNDGEGSMDVDIDMTIG